MIAIKTNVKARPEVPKAVLPVKEPAYQTMRFADHSAAYRPYPGSEWKVDEGMPIKCTASKFCAEQNRFVRAWMGESVARAVNAGTNEARPREEE